ncbi:MAG: LysR family transcriptional regulator [Elusimicrobia bacterium]|nr:LysR family transcriptional regulator [Elusimicrobiota bacterium]
MLLETLKIYRDLVDTGSFSKAAELNFLTQPAVSHQIKNLEVSLGRILLSRSNRGLTLTPAGLVFYRTAKRILETYAETLAQLQTVSGGLSSTVRISTIYSLGTYVLQGHIQRFIRRNPDVKFSVSYQKAGRIYDDIIRNRADLGVLAYPARRRGVEIVPLYDDELVLACHPEHELAQEPRLELARLDGKDFIAFDEAAPTRAALDKVLRAHNVRVSVKLELDNIETIKSAIQAGTGVSIVPEAAVRNEIVTGKIHAARFSGLRLLRPVAAVVRKGGPPSPAARSFLDSLSKEKAQLARPAGREPGG